MFLRNSWYVFGWTKDLEGASGPLGRVMLGEPIVVWRAATGSLHAMADRCPHRRAPLSRGRVEDSTLRCMYHGMAFGTDGKCVAVPLSTSPPDVRVRVYPAVDRHDWIWVWMGDADRADESLIPEAFGISDPHRPMQSNSIEYDAHYQLVHDNLCDLSHVDFVHATTLQPATGVKWSESAPRVHMGGRSIRFERWFEDVPLPRDPGVRVDTWSTYDFVVPGIFIMESSRYPAGTAAAFGGKAPSAIEPIVRNIEQQAVTPISSARTAYHYATGVIGSSPELAGELAKRMDIVMAAFVEDREMIEAQQKIWDLTPAGAPMHFLPQDKGPHLMRRLMQRLIDEETTCSEGLAPEPCAVV